MSTSQSESFFSELLEQAIDQLGSQLSAEFYPLQRPAQGDFPWRHTRGGDGLQNLETQNFVSGLITPGQVTETAQLMAPGSFTNSYVQLLSNLTYQLNNEDRAKLQAAADNAELEGETVVTNYQNNFGPITEEQLQEAAVATRLDYIIGFIMGQQWSGRNPPLTYREMLEAPRLRDLLPRMPASGNQAVTDVINYLSLQQEVVDLQSQEQQGNYVLRSLRNNAQFPNAGRGGIQTFDPTNGAVSDGFNVSYEVSPTTQMINNELMDPDRVITVGLTTSESTQDTVSVNVGVRGSIAAANPYLRFQTNGGVNYDMARSQGTSTQATVSFRYEGFSVVSVQPRAWQITTNEGFYYGNPISQAVQNQGRDVSGFHFISAPSFDLETIGNGGTFGHIEQILISNPPTVEITYTNANFSQFQSVFDQGVSGNLTLFGIINLGNFSQGSHRGTLRKGSDNSTFTVSFGPSPEVTSVPLNQQTAHVIGIGVRNPGAGPSDTIV